MHVNTFFCAGETKKEKKCPQCLHIMHVNTFFCAGETKKEKKCPQCLHIVHVNTFFVLGWVLCLVWRLLKSASE
jgi:hypothetical protein